MCASNDWTPGCLSSRPRGEGVVTWLIRIWSKGRISCELTGQVWRRSKVEESCSHGDRGGNRERMWAQIKERLLTRTQADLTAHRRLRPHDDKWASWLVCMSTRGCGLTDNQEPLMKEVFISFEVIRRSQRGHKRGTVMSQWSHWMVTVMSEDHSEVTSTSSDHSSSYFGIKSNTVSSYYISQNALQPEVVTPLVEEIPVQAHSLQIISIVHFDLSPVKWAGIHFEEATYHCLNHSEHQSHQTQKHREVKRPISITASSESGCLNIRNRENRVVLIDCIIRFFLFPLPTVGHSDIRKLMVKLRAFIHYHRWC